MRKKNFSCIKSERKNVFGSGPPLIIRWPINLFSDSDTILNASWVMQRKYQI